MTLFRHPLILLFLVCWATDLHADVICQSVNGHTIASKVAFVPPVNFTESFLNEYLLRYVRNSEEEKLYLTITSEPELFQRLTTRSFVPVLLHRDSRVDPFELTAPVALLYKMGSTSLFEYQGYSGEPEWVVLEGQNTLSRSFEGFSVHFVGQKFRRNTVYPRSCDYRTLYFVVPELEKLGKSQILKISNFYEKHFPYPENLDIHLYEGFGDVSKRLGRTSLEALSRGVRESGRKLGRHVLFLRYQTSEKTYSRRLSRYQGQSLISTEQVAFP